MYKTVKDYKEYLEITEGKDAVLIYFSHEKCSVCKVLKPKIEELINKDFPKIELYYCDTVELPEVAAQNSIFTVPVILVYFGGKESFRKARNLGIKELCLHLERPYHLIFEK